MTMHDFLIRRIAHVLFIASLAVTPAVVRAQQSAASDARPATPPTTPRDTTLATPPATTPATTAATALASTNASNESRTATSGPLVQPVALRAVSAHALPAPAPIPAPRAGAPVAMMGVGIAAIIVGSIVGGDSGTIIAVTGAAIGLSGLYLYLR